MSLVIYDTCESKAAVTHSAAALTIGMMDNSHHKPPAGTVRIAKVEPLAGENKAIILA